MRKNVIIRCAMVLMCLAVLTSCGSRGYHDLPFGGMNGRVQKVTVWHLMPEMWHAGNEGTDVMYVNTSVYDVYGNEICSAVLDSAERVQAEAESLYENGVCVRSIQKAGSRTIARLSLISNEKGKLVYNKEMDGRVVRMTVKESSFGRRHKSVVSEDGNVTMISIIRTDRKGYPKKIITTDAKTGLKTTETNIFDENHNVIEKHIATNDGKEEQITFTQYSEPDEHGNWKDCRTYNDFKLPVEVLVREVEYWE